MSSNTGQYRCRLTDSNGTFIDEEYSTLSVICKTVCVCVDVCGCVEGRGLDGNREGEGEGEGEGMCVPYKYMYVITM